MNKKTVLSEQLHRAISLQQQVLPDAAIQAIFRAEDEAIEREARARNVAWR